MDPAEQRLKVIAAVLSQFVAHINDIQFKSPFDANKSRRAIKLPFPLHQSLSTLPANERYCFTGLYRVYHYTSSSSGAKEQRVVGREKEGLEWGFGLSCGYTIQFTVNRHFHLVGREVFAVIGQLSLLLCGRSFQCRARSLAVTLLCVQIRFLCA